MYKVIQQSKGIKSMGMAAGQARLLSITSRMSDNELRAQIINNNKMRLATESSQVSEAYVAALNEAQLMFTNYDANDNASFQQLTFNALNTFNPYNNQYFLTNASGQVLVSEIDDFRFEQADRDINKFLQQYGLEATTTYFENLPKDGNGNVTYTDFAAGYEVSSGYEPEKLKNMYLGNEADGYLGYENIVSGPDYYNFSSLMDDYNEKLTAYQNSISGAMTEKLNSMTPNIDELITNLNKVTDKGELKSLYESAGTLLSNMGVNKDDNEFFSYVKTGIEGINVVDFNIDEKSIYAENPAANQKSLIVKEVNDEIYLYLNTKSVDDKDEPSFKIKDGVLMFPKEDDAGNTIWESISAEPQEPNKWERNLDGVKYTYEYNSTANTFSCTASISLSIQEVGKTIADYLEYLREHITDIWNKSDAQWREKDGTERPQWLNLKNACLNIAKQYGININEDTVGENVDNFNDITWLLDKASGNGKAILETLQQAVILDNIMNTYGEPKIAWIDTSSTSNPKEYNTNGQAKYQWYSNIFNHIVQNGRQVLLDGLASSPEWIKFAFESRLVNMEQVDGSGQTWKNINYANCSDIIEQTNSAAVAKAEAEYNAAMNKIENKDKRYDLELKNIDTEHNSLQTEYESIKTAITKNIERTFKLYS